MHQFIAALLHYLKQTETLRCKPFPTLADDQFFPYQNNVVCDIAIKLGFPQR